MYQVFRFTEGICGALQGSFSSLREAYDSASDLRRRDLHSYRDYRIHGPAPRLDVCTQLQIHPSTRDVWYVLDSSDAQLPAIRASKVLLLLGQLAQPRPSAQFSVIGLRDQYRWIAKDGFSTLDEAKEYAIARHNASPETTFEVVQNTKTVARVVGSLRPSAPARPPAPSSALIRRSRRSADHTIYRVIRIEQGQRMLEDDSFLSLDAACEYALSLLRLTTDPNITYEVEYDLPVRAHPSKRRHRDIALAHRGEEELGIGIPAQTGHGRRSRRGLYNP